MKRSKLHLSGIQLMTQSAVAFSLMALCVKIVTERLPPFQVVFFRSFLGVLLVLPFIARKKVSLWGKERLKLTARGISGCLALLLHFYTISKLDLGLAVMLNYTAPIFAVVLGVFLLRERPGIFVWVLILLSFFGVVLLNSNTGITWRPEVWLALLSSVFAAIAYVSIRTIRHRESPFTVIFYFTMISTVGSLFFVEGWKWPDPREWCLIGGVVIFSFYGQLWMTTSLRRAPSYLVTPFQYLHPVLSFGYGWILWKNPVTLTTTAGILLIILSGSLISWFGTRKKESLPASLSNESCL
ncbi:MAG TPA: DMT family transporter [Candidatus Omnitrophota bacterium]|nr:DMT family transporter [Candidatus Omnitrophota bacterium]HPS37273.1 DMT family transporter [Candidatus Omnitrophota bacterium]